MFAGYLPTFWLKVRLLAAPVIQSHLATHWPVALGGLAQITVGMIATFVSISCVVASDVGAFTIGTRPRPPLQHRSLDSCHTPCIRVLSKHIAAEQICFWTFLLRDLLHALRQSHQEA